MVSVRAFVLSLFVTNLNFFWYLGKVVFRDCGFPMCLPLYSVLTIDCSNDGKKGLSIYTPSFFLLWALLLYFSLVILGGAKKR